MIPFSPPRIDQKIIDAVSETLKSGWITTGPKTKLFEKQLTAYCGSKSTVCMNSATAALEMALRWYGIGPGDEVILPAYTYSATANVVMHCGATPVFVDVNEVDFNINVEEIRKHITPKTKVIMPVDFAGYPCDYDELYALVNESGIKNSFTPTSKEQEQLGRILILADAAHSIGGWYKGKRSGSLADFSAISFHAVKNLTTAEGGCLCLNLPEPFDNEALYKQFCVKILHGQTKDAFAKLQPANWRYDIVEPGYKFNMTDIMASIGLVELGRYDDDTLKKRKHIFDRYTQHFNTFDWAQTPIYETSDKTSSYHVYPLRIKGIDETTRDAILSEVFTNQVSVNVHFLPLPMTSYYKEQGYSIVNYPQTFDNYSREISLPVFYDLTDAQIDQVLSTVTAAIEHQLKVIHD